tara:strand:- start:77882 stop:79345 length:1464 start_codon:yes stop_codon:yes gene_type:complete
VGESKPKEITLDYAIKQVIENNFDIALSRIAVKIANEEKTEIESEFDLSLYANATTSTSKAPYISTSTTTYFDSLSTSDLVEFSITGKSVYGSTYSLGVESGKTYTNPTINILDPMYIVGLKAEFVMPLLQGLGKDATLWKVRLAENKNSISLLKLKSRINDLTLKTEETFWELVYAVENLNVQNEFLDWAREWEKRVRMKVDVGLLPPIEIIQARASVASREENVLAANNRIDAMSDSLLQLINPPHTSVFWTDGIVPIDEPVPLDKSYDLNTNIEKALSKRPELLIAKVEVKNKDIEMVYRRNQQLPEFDLIASVTLTGTRGNARTTDGYILDGTINDALSDAISGEDYDYALGLQFVYPFGNRLATAAKVKAKLELASVVLNIKKLEQNIIMETRAAIRQINFNKKQIIASKIARKLAEEKLTAEVSKFDVGLSTSFNVLEFQKDLAFEKSKELRAIVDYKKSTAYLKKSVGELLESHGYLFEK